MASQAETEIPQLFERLVRHRDLSLFLPFILGFSSATNTGTPDQETIILINPFTQGMVLIDGLDSLFGELAPKNGHPPASKASIEALPTVDVKKNGDGDDRVNECAICLEEWDADDGLVVKEMPCKHRFHGNCIHKWLRIHGSCPVCRYKLPTDDEGFNKKMGQEEAEGRRRIGREIWVSFSINSSSRTRSSDDDSNQSSHQ